MIFLYRSRIALLSGSYRDVIFVDARMCVQFARIAIIPSAIGSVMLFHFLCLFCTLNTGLRWEMRWFIYGHPRANLVAKPVARLVFGAIEIIDGDFYYFFPPMLKEHA